MCRLSDVVVVFFFCGSVLFILPLAFFLVAMIP